MKEINVTGSIQPKNKKAYIVLSWYENGKRKQQWISTELPEKGNACKKQQMLHDAITEEQTRLDSIRRTNESEVS